MSVSLSPYLRAESCFQTAFHEFHLYPYAMNMKKYMLPLLLLLAVCPLHAQPQEHSLTPETIGMAAHDTLVFRTYAIIGILPEVQFVPMQRMYKAIQARDNTLITAGASTYWGSYGERSVAEGFYSTFGQSPGNSPYFCHYMDSYHNGERFSWLQDGPTFDYTEFLKARKQLLKTFKKKKQFQQFVEEEKQRVVESLTAMDTLMHWKPILFTLIHSKAYKGDIRRYVDDLYSKSCMLNRRQLRRTINAQNKRYLAKDLGFQYSLSMDLFEVWITDVRKQARELEAEAEAERETLAP